jgi:hypothetical protein
LVPLDGMMTRGLPLSVSGIRMTRTSTRLLSRWGKSRVPLVVWRAIAAKEG